MANLRVSQSFLEGAAHGAGHAVGAMAVKGAVHGVKAVIRSLRGPSGEVSLRHTGSYFRDPDGSLYFGTSPHQQWIWDARVRSLVPTTPTPRAVCWAHYYTGSDNRPYINVFGQGWFGFDHNRRWVKL